MDAIHPIGVVSRKTGLSAHVIRVWERRYGAVAPERSDGNQRLYTDAEIDRLVLLAKAVAGGESIGKIARLTNEELKGIVKTENQFPGAPASSTGNGRSVSTATRPVTGPSIHSAVERIKLSDNKSLRSIISERFYTYGLADLIEAFVPELLTWIGEEWQGGNLTIYQEHMASETIRSFLGTVFDDVNTGGKGRTVITATPPGELHDIGSLLSAIAAAAAGFDVVHLGADVPLIELIRLCLIRRPAALLLSIIFDSTDEKLVQGLRNVREMIDPDTQLFIGGRGSGWYHDRLDNTNIQHIATLSDLRDALSNISDTV
jgi:DNA-binding transcriptional MerR regulator/methylmalonyl-CoA mutase cobalamin-binding subunit